ncbi:DUF1566 domain-containing protein [Desulfobotulus mexicanus]|uniref:DUF1566 domain-containing protein n=1 Tax=Desulfobotulus mexicanus TaxID=2586642 RepID=A0A5S5MFR2_9BACT|nr:DUF1566 domain-containing protein [Desulfobotulus mexicanus]TYT74475.1 DUF1566 domain-containing protein [Desulfobotulus mexicanus]
MEEKNCPVCGLQQNEESEHCKICDWEFALIPGSNQEDLPESVLAKLEEARKKWAEMWMNRDDEPDFERDPFEYEEERISRLKNVIWKVGKAVLIKEKYDIKTGRFHMKWVETAEWAKPFMDGRVPVLTLERDAARSLYVPDKEFIIGLRFNVTEEKIEVASGVVCADKAILGCLFETDSLAVSMKNIKVSVIEINHDTELAKAEKFVFIDKEGRFKDLKDGTVLDTKTGLQWMRCALGQTWEGNTCNGVAKEFTWNDAMEEAKTCSFARKKDWRVPIIEELKTLIDKKYKPQIHPDAFPNFANGGFWSSSLYANRSLSAWYFHFGYGDVYNVSKNCTLQVRLVRAGQ